MQINKQAVSDTIIPITQIMLRVIIPFLFATGSLCFVGIDSLEKSSTVLFSEAAAKEVRKDSVAFVSLEFDEEGGVETGVFLTANCFPQTEHSTFCPMNDSSTE